MVPCEECGTTFQQVARGRPRRFCLGCRPSKAPARKVQRKRACVECGSSFSPTNAATKFCSRRCVDRSRRVPCASCGSLIFISSTSRGVGASRCRPCTRSSCGTLGAYRRGCRCVECRRASAQEGRKHEHHWISAADRLAIYERDDWTCQLCSEPLDLEVHHLDRRAPSLDHIEPRSFALIPDHSPANLRAAHRGCNSARGNRVDAA